jgi:hypothetical protein
MVRQGCHKQQHPVFTDCFAGSWHLYCYICLSCCCSLCVLAAAGQDHSHAAHLAHGWTGEQIDETVNSAIAATSVQPCGQHTAALHNHCGVMCEICRTDSKLCDATTPSLFDIQ